MSQSEIIEITVSGPVGSGKSHVLSVIEAALKAEYGKHVPVASRALSEERGLVGEAFTKPNAQKVIFVLHEAGAPAQPNKDARRPSVIID